MQDLKNRDMKEINNYTTMFTKEIISNIFNHYLHNYDFYSFGKQVQKGLLNKIKMLILIVSNKILQTLSRPIIKRIHKTILNNECQIATFQLLYELLEDEYSKNLLIKVLCYRILGLYKVKLPLNTVEYWKKISFIKEKCTNENNYISPSNCRFILYRMNLNKIDFPLELYFIPEGVHTTFVLKQYDYPNCKIKAEKGDVVIDAGACWGDTALYFAHQVGKTGKVYSFEFEPENLDVLYKNLGMNLKYSKTVNVIEKPLWNESGNQICYSEKGPASSISFERRSINGNTVDTISIDDWVANNKIDKIDFIKMDIEGAELNALQGAITTLTRFKPKLAISLYHKISDFQEIPKFIKSLNLGYKFYFNHYTIHTWESVLFAISDN